MDMQDSMVDVLKDIEDTKTRRVLILIVDLIESLNQRLQIVEGLTERHQEYINKKTPSGGGGGLSIG